MTEISVEEPRETEEPCDRRGVDCRPTQMPVVDTGAQTSRMHVHAQIVEYCTDLLKFARIWWRPKKIVWWHMRGWRACPSLVAPSATPLHNVCFVQSYAPVVKNAL